MFNSKDKKNESGKSGSLTPSAVGHSLNTLSKGTLIEGTIKANSDIRIDGTIKGKLFCEAKVIIGPSGVIEGDVTCQNAVIEGKFDGTITVKELLNVRENATINGDVTTGKLIIQPGGIFNVNCTMGGGNFNKTTQQNKQEGGKAGKPIGA